MSETLQAPFPWFGGKSRAAELIWSRFGRVDNYVEAFAGSLAVLLGRPDEPQTETCNDVDGFVVNVWRALQADPERVAHYADWPVSEADLTARHLWIVRQREDLTLSLQGDPFYFDARVAGWWLYGICAWIGSGFCAGTGPWISLGGHLVDTRKLPHLGDAGQGINRQLPHLGNAGRGVNRKLPHLGNAGRGVNRKLPHLGDAGQGINRQLPHLGNAGRGVNRKLPHLGDASPLVAYFDALAERLRDVRICCGDWSRVVTPSVTTKHGVTAVLLDPPYSDEDDRTMGLYADDSGSVAHAVREWAIANGDDPLLRIALCGYADQHEMPEGWVSATWTARKGYQSGDRMERVKEETVWFSRSCLNPAESLPLFAGLTP